MKKYLVGAIMTLMCITPLAKAGAISIGVVDFRACIENSEIGKQQKANLESMKNQMEKMLGEKEKQLNELATKLNDSDYMDSLSEEAEQDLKNKFRSISQEMSQMQNQYLQTLQQANMKIIQKLSEAITNASEAIAKEKKIDLVLNNDVLFYHETKLDLTQDVVEKMNQQHKETKDNS